MVRKITAKVNECCHRFKGRMLLLLIILAVFISSFFLFGVLVSGQLPSIRSSSFPSNGKFQLKRLSEWQSQLFQSSSENRSSSQSGCGAVDAPFLKSFEILQSNVLGSLHSQGCQQKDHECASLETLLMELEKISQTLKNQQPWLFIVMLDPLAWQYSTQRQSMTTLNENINTLIRDVKSRRSYLKFRGSDYVFVCLSSSCTKFTSVFSKRLSNNEGSRAILVTSDPNQNITNWPCPLRVINANHYSKSQVQFWRELLPDLANLITRETRWRCSDDLHSVHYWQNANDSSYRSGLYVERHDFLLCTVAKCGSTALHLFLRRAMGKKDYSNVKLSHQLSTNGLKRIDSVKNPYLIKSVFSSEDFITGMIVRHPVARLLSAYLDKIVYNKEYYRLKGLSKFKGRNQTPTFAEFVNILIREHPDSSKGDPHFKSLVSYCGSKTTSFDFVGDVDNLHEDFVEFTKSLGIWGKFGSYGWGKYRNQSFVDAWIYKQKPHRTVERIWKYYDEELLRKVYNYYKQDFIRFHYSIDEILAQKPDHKSK